jgi:hypothetical protein
MSAAHETCSLAVDREAASFVVGTKFWDKIFVSFMSNYWNYWDQRLKNMRFEAPRQWRLIMCGIWIMTLCSMARSSYVECHRTEIRGVALGTCEKTRTNDMQGERKGDLWGPLMRMMFDIYKWITFITLLFLLHTLASCNILYPVHSEGHLSPTPSLSLSLSRARARARAHTHITL